MKLLFAGSECAPFFKTGGLGDVMGALPKTIAKTTDNDVRVVLPFFTGMAEEYKSQLSFVTSFYVKVGWRDQYCGVLKLEMDNVTYYFIDNLYYFDFTSFSGILMIMNQGGTTTMTEKETLALIETLKANNEELLKQVALLTEQVAHLTNKLYGKSSEKRAVNPDQLSLFEEDNASQDDEDLPSHYRNYYL